MQAELRPDARFMVDVCDLLGNLDVAIGFLHSVGGGPERLLVDFMSTDLRLKAALPMRVRHLRKGRPPSSYLHLIRFFKDFKCLQRKCYTMGISV